jgi:hypothetical protein
MAIVLRLGRFNNSIMISKKGRGNVLPVSPALPGSCQNSLNDFLYETRSDAAGTNLNLLDSPGLVVNASDFLKVGLPHLGMLVVCMADLVAPQRLLPTYLAHS